VLFVMRRGVGFVGLVAMVVVRIELKEERKRPPRVGCCEGEWVQYRKKRRRGLEPGFSCV
jgi:hypothetical protein